jgi:hypothetical protein
MTTMDLDPRNNAPTTRGKPFQTGNPGRPKGARHRTTLAVEVLLGGEAEALTRQAIELALKGDVTALRLCLDRIAPARKDRDVAFDAPKIDRPEDVPAALSALFDAVAAGDLTPTEGLTLANIVEKVRSAIEFAEIDRRLAMLEARSGAGAGRHE